MRQEKSIPRVSLLLVVDSLLLCKELDALLPPFLSDNLPEHGFGARYHLVQRLDQARRLRGACERRSDEEVEREFRGRPRGAARGWNIRLGRPIGDTVDWRRSCGGRTRVGGRNRESEERLEVRLEEGSSIAQFRPCPSRVEEKTSEVEDICGCGKSSDDQLPAVILAGAGTRCV